VLRYGALEEAEGSGITDVTIGVLGVFVGTMIACYESIFDGEPMFDCIPLRATFWLTMGALCFASFPMWAPGSDRHG
jgi:hypothetical protein